MEVETPANSVETTPSEPVKEAENPSNPQEPQTPQEPAEKTYDVNGRQLTADEVRQEYENLHKDYTQKSQRLAAIEKASNPQNLNNPEVPEWKRPDYQPKSWAEVVEISKAQAIEELRQQAEQEAQRTQEIASLVDQQIAEIKKTDSSLDENALFLHANKYGFRDLKAAHQNMQAIKQAEVAAEQRTLKNLQTRGATPIAGNAGTATPDGSLAYGDYSKYGSALEYIRSAFPKS